MLHRNRTLSRLLALALILGILCLAGCAQSTGQSPSGPEATVPSENPTSPTDPNASVPPSTPTGSGNERSFQDLYTYLVSAGTITVKEAIYTFTMRADNGNILLEYKDDSTSATVTLRKDTTTHPVNISFDVYTASAEVDASTYCAADRNLVNFHCNTAAIGASLKSLSTTAVWTCFSQAETAMEPSGVTLTDLGFSNY